MREFLFIIFVYCFLATGCSEKKGDGNFIPSPKNPLLKNINGGDGEVTSVKNNSETKSKLELQLIAAGLTNVHDLDSTIKVDLRYSTSKNFIGLDVYGNFDQCYLQPDVAKKLVEAENYLRKKFPYYSLIVFDAVRPLHIQQKMWDTLVLPPGEKTKYLSNPENGSLHNYGAAVDLSIIDENGILLDMGTDFDFFGDKAHPEKEKELFASGELSEREILNRELLRDVMRHGGFWGIQTEWWHFNSCTRIVAAQIYKIVE